MNERLLKGARAGARLVPLLAPRALLTARTLRIPRTLLAPLLLLSMAMMALLACGGGGGGSPAGPPPPTSSIVFTSTGGGTDSVSLAAQTPSDPTTLLLDVRATGVSGFYGVAFNLTYPTQVLHFAGVTEGTLLNAAGSIGTTFQVVESPAGTLVVGVSRLGTVPGATGSGVIATLRFTAVTSGSGSFSFSRNAGFDAAGKPLLGLGWGAGSVQVTLVR